MSAAAPTMNPRTLKLLRGAIVPTLLTMAWPNILVMLAQASTGLIETWFVSRLGTDALAGMALVFPGFMMMQMLSGGAMGGGISSAIARALGAQRRDDANALVTHALVVTALLGAIFCATFLLFGSALYRSMGARDGSLDAAMTYSNIVFSGIVVTWLMNGAASAIRGTGNMLVPSIAICVGVVLLFPLSPLLIFGWGPIPGFGIAGGGIAIVVTNVIVLASLLIYLALGKAIVRPIATALRWPMFKEILRVGAVASVSTLQTSLTAGLVTALVGTAAGPGAVAGYGTGSRLEFLLVPLVFGLGAPLVALVGTNIGAGQRDRALKIALTGGFVAFLLTETVGILAALFPHAWLGLFGQDPDMLRVGSAYLRAVGPFYGFFGLGLSLYFASQGAGRLGWPLLAGFVRMVVAVGGAWLVLRFTGSIVWAFVPLAVALVVYGGMLVTAIKAGVWFRGRA